MQEGNIFNIPQYVVAKSPQKLQELMLAKNVELQMEKRYTIIHDGKRWFAWYYHPVSGSLDALTGG